MKTAYIHTFGCKVNQFDSQVIREHFSALGYHFAQEPEEADTIILNSCTVTSAADRQCRSLIRKITAANPRARILLAGCYARRSGGELLTEFPQLELLDTASFLDKSIASFAEHSRAFLKIQDGCDAFCSYCIVPFVRPVLWSRPVSDIISQVRALVKHGYPEIVLTGVHLGKYRGGLVPVLEAILGVAGNFRLRLSSLDVSEVTDGLVALMRNNPARICRHLHIPLQSGSPAVLARMKRSYTAETFLRTVEKVREQLPDIGISTDVIVGFPGETDADFSATCSMVESILFSRLHVFRYSPRPGTAAAAMKPLVDAKTIQERSRILRAIGVAREERFWRSFAGTKRPIVMEGENHTALTDNYIRIQVDKKTGSQFNGIFELYITDINGKAWGKSSL
ncbi:MAG: MiaB/RimO family radical SAM methylthiotransferase [Elusimicrobia bacterium]|nr:MiaB/RimO family radical SAM methylthiotransferase [Elusimicrobiota bacterium]